MKFKSMAGAACSLFLALALIVGYVPQNVKAAGTTAFNDVKAGAWYEGTVQWGITGGIIKGYDDGSFKPGKTVTEAEFLAMLLRSFEPNLAAVPSITWSDIYYARAKQLNYPVRSFTDLKVRNTVILRKQVAELISSTEGVNFSGDNAIRYLLAFGLAEGKNPNKAGIQSFEGDQALTRVEALQFIKNLKDYGIGGLLDRPAEASNPNDIPQL
ncbi:S-layer homology domain-containing protein [Paenibacillus sp. sgz500958]|uniref:S-layer homology domain-containing protein n=1 Tax=Paenibacillus sp. sgz500958 TaxID=3242475 RepID=UPI0036D377A9